MLSIKQSELVKVDFRVACNHTTKKACVKTIDAILKNFNNITEIIPTVPLNTNENICVIGTAVIDPKNKSKFQNDLKKLKINSEGTRKITKAIVKQLR